MRRTVFVLFACLTVSFTTQYGCSTMTSHHRKAYLWMEELEDAVRIRSEGVLISPSIGIYRCLRALRLYAPDLPKQVINRLRAQDFRLRLQMASPKIDFVEYLALLAECGDKDALKELAFLSTAMDTQIVAACLGWSAEGYKWGQQYVGEAMKGITPGVIRIKAMEELYGIAPEQAVGVAAYAAWLDEKLAMNALEILSKHFGKEFELSGRRLKEPSFDHEDWKKIRPYLQKCRLLPFSGDLFWHLINKKIFIFRRLAK